MRPTEILTEEHNKIKSMLEIFEKICVEIENGNSVDVEKISGILDFLRGFADKYHHAKEEDLLFPAMVDAGIPSEGGPIAVMLMEHDSGRGYLKEISDGLKEYSSGDSNATAKIINNARAYSQLLVQHIFKEDNILYKMADAHLTEEQQNKLLEDFEKVSLGLKNEYENYIGFLDRMKKEYS